MCLGVKKVMSDSTAVGSLVIGSTVMDDITMTAPINKLSTAKLSTVGRKEKQALGQYSIINRRNILSLAPFGVRLEVRRALLGKSLLKEV